MIMYICDGCDKVQDAEKGIKGELCKPKNWFTRMDDDGEQHACSRECIQQISRETGKTSVVLPI